MSWRILSLVTLLFTLCGSAQYEKQEAVVRSALANGKLSKVIAKAEAALAKGGPPVFNVLRADAYIRRGLYTKALRDAKEAQAKMGNGVELRSQLVGAYLGLGQLDSALHYFSEESCADTVMQEEFLFRMGTTLERRGEWEKALVLFGKAAADHPMSPRMLRERGSCHAMMGDTVAARADLDRAVELGPHDAVNYNSRGYYLYARNGEHAKAIADFNRAIKQNPNYGFAFSNRGWSEYKLGDVERARKDLSLALRKNAGNSYAYRSLGIIALESGDRERGCERFKSALENGFSASYGPEVERLVEEHCSAIPVVAPDLKETPAPSNAPGNASEKAPRNNAP